jgi:hypothetical protein
MKTLVCLIAVLAMTAPVLATTVTIVGDTSVPGELTLKYYVTPDTAALRGVALTLNSDVATTNAADTTAGENWNVCLDYAYDRMTAIPPESYSLGDGGPLAKVDGPGVPAGDVSDFSICVGMVDESGAQGGVPAGSAGAPEELCTIVLTGLPATVTAAADTLRGGAVGSPVDIVFDMDGNGTPGDNTIDVPGAEPDCPKGGTPEQIAKWNAWGKPANWCGDCWLIGDVDGNCAITFADVQMVYADFLQANKTLPPASTGRSDNDMNGAITFADVQKVYGAFLPPTKVCPVPCTPLP